jgi:hypothetical protein
LNELFEDALLNYDVILALGISTNLSDAKIKGVTSKYFGVRGSYKNGHWDLFSEAEQRKFP